MLQDSVFGQKSAELSERSRRLAEDLAEFVERAVQEMNDSQKRRENGSSLPCDDKEAELQLQTARMIRQFLPGNRELLPIVQEKGWTQLLLGWLNLHDRPAVQVEALLALTSIADLCQSSPTGIPDASSIIPPIGQPNGHGHGPMGMAMDGTMNLTHPFLHRGSLSSNSQSNSHSHPSHSQHQQQQQQHQQQHKFIVPPYLMLMNPEYQIFEDNSKQGIFITEFIQKESANLSKILTSSTKMIIQHFDNVDDNGGNSVNTHKGKNVSSLLEETLSKRILDITSSVIIIDNEKYKSINSSTSTAITKLLEDVVTSLNNTFYHNSSTSSSDGNCHSNNHNENVEDRDQDKGKNEITVEALLLSIFGWRRTSRPANIISHNTITSTIMDNDDKEQKNELFVKCNICHNCVPIIYEKEHEVLIPPNKRRKIVGNTNNTTAHQFHLINSHRHYCPFVSGFRNDDTSDFSEKSNNGTIMDNAAENVDQGTAEPCWEVLWGGILKKFKFLRKQKRDDDITSSITIQDGNKSNDSNDVMDDAQNLLNGIRNELKSSILKKYLS